MFTPMPPCWVLWVWSTLICLDPQFSKRLRLSGYHTDGLSLELCGFLGGCQYGRASSNAAPSNHGLPSRTGSGWNLWFLGLENLEWPGEWATRLSCRVRGFRYWRHRGCLVCLILKDNHNLKHTLRVLGFLMSIFCSYISKSSMFWSQSPPVNRPSLQNYVICKWEKMGGCPLSVWIAKLYVPFLLANCWWFTSD